MEYIPVIMIRETLTEIAQFDLPSRFIIRPFKRGEEVAWADIETSAGEFPNISTAMDRFRREFAESIEDMKQRCMFVETMGRPVGTATAWYNGDFRDGHYGRLHWVSIHKDFQGRGLSKPLIYKTLTYMAEKHHKAYLTTQTTSLRAIKVYLDFGFLPLMSTDGAEEAWHAIAKDLNNKTLGEFLAQHSS